MKSFRPQKKHPAPRELCYEFWMPEIPAYYIRGDDGVEYGPIDLAELREWVVENRVGLGTSVRLDEQGEQWNLWQHYPELVALLAEVRATSPSAVPVLARIERRAAAFVGDLVVSFLLVAPLIVLLYCLLPADLIASMAFYSQAVLNGLTPPGPQPVLPFWFQVSGDILLLVVPMAYYGGFHALRGRTPFKSLLKIQVVDAQGNKPRLDKALLRAFIFTVCVYYFYGVPLCISICFAFLDPQRRALHDIAAGTYVVES